MAFMLVRVELHENSSTDKPTSADYDKLHVKMKGAGFSREITVTTLPSGLGAGEYELPKAMYGSSKFASANAALGAAWEAAKGLGYNYSVVTAGSDFDGFGLKLMKK